MAVHFVIHKDTTIENTLKKKKSVSHPSSPDGEGVRVSVTVRINQVGLKQHTTLTLIYLFILWQILSLISDKGKRRLRCVALISPAL